MPYNKAHNSYELGSWKNLCFNSNKWFEVSVEEAGSSLSCLDKGGNGIWDTITSFLELQHLYLFSVI